MLEPFFAGPGTADDEEVPCDIDRSVRIARVYVCKIIATMGSSLRDGNFYRKPGHVIDPGSSTFSPNSEPPHPRIWNLLFFQGHVFYMMVQSDDMRFTDSRGDEISGSQAVD